MQTQDKVLPVDIGIRRKPQTNCPRLSVSRHLFAVSQKLTSTGTSLVLFHSLHQMFEEQYTELAMAVDTICRKDSFIGILRPGSYSEFTELSSIKETREVSAEDMVRLLTQGNEAVVRTAQSPPAAERGDDESTKDAERLRYMKRLGCCGAFSTRFKLSSCSRSEMLD